VTISFSNNILHDGVSKRELRHEVEALIKLLLNINCWLLVKGYLGEALKTNIPQTDLSLKNKKYR